MLNEYNQFRFGHRRSESTEPDQRFTVVCCKLVLAATLLSFSLCSQAATPEGDDLGIALSLANTLRAARTVIANNQTLINDASIGDKGLTGERVVKEALKSVQDGIGHDPLAIDANSKHGKLLRALLDSIAEVMDENQQAINREGVEFKGFVPAVFARLTNERFGEKVGQLARIKVTAPIDLVRNRKSRPDTWERSVLDEKFNSTGWTRGELFAEIAQSNQRDAFRVMVPEYYGAGCLSCHGTPKDEIDVTGYPKEGGALGDLGGAISITLFQ